MAKNILSTDNNVRCSTSDSINLDLDVLLALQPDYLADIDFCKAIEAVDVTIGKRRKVKVNKVGNNQIVC